MITDADRSYVKNIDTDVLIVGAGVAGITLALELENTPLKVTLVESGGFSITQDQQKLYEGVQSGWPSQPLDRTRLRFFGGSSNHWAGWCRPLEPIDFVAKPSWQHAGWPLNIETLTPYYQRAAIVAELGPQHFNDIDYWLEQDQQLTSLPIPSGKLQTSLFQVSPPTRFGQKYRPQLTVSKNIQVLLNLNVLDMEQETSNDGTLTRISRIKAKTHQGLPVAITAKSVILATGGIENPRLMLASKGLNGQGIGNDNDLVGRYFQNHPWISRAAAIRLNQPIKALPLYLQQTEIQGAKLFATLTPKADAQTDAGIGSFRIVLNPIRSSSLGSDSLRYTLEKIKQAEWPDHLGEHIGNIASDWDVITNSAYKTLFNSKEDLLSISTDKILGLGVDLNFEQRPQYTSRVTLGTDQDRFGMPRVDVNWQLHEDDRKTASNALNWLAQSFGQNGLGRTRFKMDLAADAPWPDRMTGSRHHMGTTRMSADPQDGVVNPDCRVHSVDNLYVAGSSVFPNSGYANPTLTIIALTIRLADHLKRTLL